MVTCGFCRHEFEEDRMQSACRACPLGSDCGLIRCPKCGYENPGTPRWIAFLKKKLGKRAEAPAPQRELPLPMLPVNSMDAGSRGTPRGEGERRRPPGVGAPATGGGPSR